MRAMVLERVGEPLRLREVEPPRPGPGELLLEVSTCGVCRTDLHIFDGELTEAALPLILGHEIVGRVAAHGEGVGAPSIGTRVGVPWLGRTCGACADCAAGRENLCSRAVFTGYGRNGGYAEYAVADASFCLTLDLEMEATEAAPLLCAGLIGYRALHMAGGTESGGETPRRLGLYGFGAAAHLLCQLATARASDVYAFTRPGDESKQRLARRLGAAWAGGSDRPPPEPLDAAILFAPAGDLVPRALAAVRPGGVVVCAGIHMSPIPEMPYELLWGERVLCSVANLTRRDGDAFLAAVRQTPIRSHVETLPLEEANRALERLRAGEVEGALVLVP